MLPVRANRDDAGLDLVAVEAARIEAGGRRAVPTGLAVAIPPGHTGLVMPRSGLARRHGITLANSPGVIDSGYRGEVQVVMINLGEDAYDVAAGDRIAQLLVVAVDVSTPIEVDVLPESDGRDASGFGSSGR